MGWAGSQSSALSAKAGNPIWKACPCLGAGGAALATRSLPTSGLRYGGGGGGRRILLPVTCHCPWVAPPAPRLQTMPSRTHSGGHSFMPGPLASPTASWLQMSLSCPTPHLPSSLIGKPGDKWPPPLWTSFVPTPPKGQMAPCSRMPSAPSRPLQHCVQPEFGNWLLCQVMWETVGCSPGAGMGTPGFPGQAPPPGLFPACSTHSGLGAGRLGLWKSWSHWLEGPGQVPEMLGSFL